MRIKGKIWRTGGSKVITVPIQLETEVGDEYWITLERCDEKPE